MKNLKYYIVGVVVLVLIVLFFVRNYQYKELQEQNQLQSIQLAAINDSVKIYKSKNGELTAKVQSVEVDNRNKKDALEQAGYTIKDLKARDIKWWDIVNTLQAEIASSGGGQTVLHDTTYITTTDTIKAAEFSWNNRYLFLEGKVYEKTKLSEKTLDFTYTYKTGIDIISTKKKNAYIINAYLSDPNAVVTTATSLTITNKTPWYKKQWLWGAVGFLGGYLIPK